MAPELEDSRDAAPALALLCECLCGRAVQRAQDGTKIGQDGELHRCGPAEWPVIIPRGMGSPEAWPRRGAA